MSWFETSHIAYLAKTALKEAQKTIDKALDIKDEESPIIRDAKKSVITSNLQSITRSHGENSQTINPNSSDSAEGYASNSENMSVHTTQYEEETPDLERSEESEKPDSFIVVSTSLQSQNDVSIEETVKQGAGTLVTEENLESKSELNVPITMPPKRAKQINVLMLASPATDLDAPKSSGSFDEVELDSNTLANVAVESKLSDSIQSFENLEHEMTESIDVPTVYSIENSSESSTEHKNELAKHSSGHTSADEAETGTSSDVEIISSPNGDTSSTNSGAYISIVFNEKNRTLSTVKLSDKEKISQCYASDDQSDIGLFVQRVGELNDLLKVRDLSIVEISRINAELQRKNAEMERQIDAKQKLLDNVEQADLAGQYTQRLTALEKKFQVASQECDNLREQTRLLKQEADSKVPKEKMHEIIKEKDVVIEELRFEGENLAKQVLNHSNIIKKLRAKEQDHEKNQKQQKKQNEDMSQEIDRLKRLLTAKEDIEKCQIEAVHRLSSENRTLAKDLAEVRSSLDDTTKYLDASEQTLSVAKQELDKKKQANNELLSNKETIKKLSEENETLRKQNNHLMSESSELQKKMQQAETNNLARHQKLRADNIDLMRRLEAAEERAEQLAQDTSLTTLPLIRQLETLQVTLQTRAKIWEKQEQVLVEKLAETQKKLCTLTSCEQMSTKEVEQLNSRLVQVEESLLLSQIACEQAKDKLQKCEIESQLQESSYKSQIHQLESALHDKSKKVLDLENSVFHVKEQLAESRINCNIDGKEHAAKSSTQSVQEIKKMVSSELMPSEQEQESPAWRELSPTASLCHSSFGDSIEFNAWNMDDQDCLSNSHYQTSVYGGKGNATQFENLQSCLKQRDGEVQQLQWEISRLQSERTYLTTEVSTLTLEIEELKNRLDIEKTYHNKYTELQHQYDALLEMYGEKEDETQELLLDLQDVKEMYKMQIDELLNKKNSDVTPE